MVSFSSALETARLRLKGACGGRGHPALVVVAPPPDPDPVLEVCLRFSIVVPLWRFITSRPSLKRPGGSGGSRGDRVVGYDTDGPFMEPNISEKDAGNSVVMVSMAACEPMTYFRLSMLVANLGASYHDSEHDIYSNCY